MNIENMTIVSNEICESMIFHDEQLIFTDIDTIFKKSNIIFASTLLDLGLDVDFNFVSTYNKNLYTHAFLHTACEYIKSLRNYRVTFYNNTLTKDPFKIRLIKKFKRIFGFKILDGILEFSTMVFKIKSHSSEWTPRLEVFLMTENKPKTFKHIKKYLLKTGLTQLNDEYFRQISNKMLILS